HQVRRYGEVMNPAPRNAELLVQGRQFSLERGVGPRIAEACGYIEQGTGVIVPMALVERPSRVPHDAVPSPVANVLIRTARLPFFRARQAKTNDREMG